MLRDEGIDEIRQQPLEHHVLFQVQKLVEKNKGVFYYNEEAFPLEKNLKISSKLYVTVKNEDKFDVFLKEYPDRGYKYIINYSDKIFNLLEDVYASAASNYNGTKVRKITLQPKVKRTEDFLPLTFTLDGEVSKKHIDLMGLWVMVEYSPSAGS